MICSSSICKFVYSLYLHESSSRKSWLRVECKQSDCFQGLSVGLPARVKNVGQLVFPHFLWFPPIRCFSKVTVEELGTLYCNIILCKYRTEHANQKICSACRVCPREFNTWCIPYKCALLCMSFATICTDLHWSECQWWRTPGLQTKSKYLPSYKGFATIRYLPTLLDDCLKITFYK